MKMHTICCIYSTFRMYAETHQKKLVFGCVYFVLRARVVASMMIVILLQCPERLLPRLRHPALCGPLQPPVPAQRMAGQVFSSFSHAARMALTFPHCDCAFGRFPHYVSET